MPERRLPFLILLASLLLTAYSASALTCNVLPFGATNGTVSWNAARVNTYGAVAGFPALSLSSPVSDEEAKALLTLFGSDDYFGASWTILHLIESAPNWPIDECLTNTSNEWIVCLKERAQRGRDEPTRQP